MAEHDDAFDPTRLERMERRLQALEDAEAIRNLKSRYAALCDDNYDANGIAALFAEDATWESPGLGRFEGRDAIRRFFQGAAGIFSFAIHYSLNGQIYVGGDTARAQWGYGGAYTRLTFQNNGPVASSFPVKLLRYAVGIWN